MSKTKVLELRQKRAKLIADARALLDTAESAKRDLTSEEQTNWDTMMNDADALRVQAERAERMVTAEADLGIAQRGDLGGGGAQPAGAPVEFQRGDLGGGGAQPAGAPVEFQSLGLRGLSGTNAGWRESREWRNLMRTASPEYVQGFRGYLREGSVAPELRALQADLDTAGGYFLPVTMLDQLIKTVDDAVFMRQLATIYTVPNGDTIGVPTLENDPSSPTWTSELATGDLDDSMSFGKRAMQTHPIAKRLKISRKLLMKVPNIESLVMQRLGYKFGIAMESAYLLGHGAGMPLGVFVSSDDGVPASRNYSTGATTTATNFDHLLGAKYMLKGQYHSRARWLFHREVVGEIAKLKDGNGQYLWRESTRAGEPDRLLGLPIVMSEYAPSTMTSGQFIGMLADFSEYYILDSMSMEFQRLTELYAEQNTVGIIGRMDTDGAPVLPEAFVRLALA